MKTQDTSLSDPAVAAYYALGPQRFGYWDSVHLKRPLRPERWSEIELTMRLVSSLERDVKSPVTMQCLLLEFTNVSQLKFGQFEMLGGVHVEIRSIRENQWDGLNYRIFDYEQTECISFYCRDFTAKLVDR